MPSLAVIVPVLDDSDALGRLLADLRPDAIDTIVVDGGSDPALDRLAGEHPRLHLLRSAAGRGRQMNAGAAASSAEWLLFLHADSRLPTDWLDAVSTIDDGVIAAWFRFGLDDEAWQARVIERLVAWRVSVFRLPYGDQGLLVRRSAFVAVGGFPDWPLMEDVEIWKRLAAAGPAVELPLTLRTSSRRWRRDGWWRRSSRNLTLLSLYFAGVPPGRLARWY